MIEIATHLELVTDPAFEPLEVEYVRDEHLRVASDNLENTYIESLIRVARRMAERHTRRALVTQEWELVLDRFPCAGDVILVPKPPLQFVESITYVDEDGVTQTWGGSPLPYDVSIPSGPLAGKARIRPAYNVEWPTTRCQMDAVTVTFSAGYPDVGSPPESQVPDDILHGMLLVIGEMYKQRSLSVHAFNQNPSIIQAKELWSAYRVY